MIKDKRKLASPLISHHILGDDNEDIPLQMTEEQQVNIITTYPGGCNNTLVTEPAQTQAWIGSGPSTIAPVTFEDMTSKQIKNLQKNKNNLEKLQMESNLKMKQYKLVTEIISEIEFDDQQPLNTKNIQLDFNDTSEVLDNSMVTLNYVPTANVA
jgi:hypothetical protein